MIQFWSSNVNENKIDKYIVCVSLYTILNILIAKFNKTEYNVYYEKSLQNKNERNNEHFNNTKEFSYSSSKKSYVSDLINTKIANPNIQSIPSNNESPLNSNNNNFNGKSYKVNNLNNEIPRDLCECPEVGVLDENFVKKLKEVNIYIFVPFLGFFIQTIKLSPYFTFLYSLLYVFSDYYIFSFLMNYLADLYYTVHTFETITYLFENIGLILFLLPNKLTEENAITILKLFFFISIQIFMYLFSKTRKKSRTIYITHYFILFIIAHVYSINAVLPEWYKNTIGNYFIKEDKDFYFQFNFLNALYFIALVLIHLRIF